jgi:signal peptidase II
MWRAKVNYVSLHKRAQIKNLQWLGLSILVILLDQFTKSLVTHYLFYGESITILPIFNITLAHNTGSAFSFLASASGWQIWFFTAVSIIVSTALFIWIYRLPLGESWSAAALSLILGGALGNLIDRLSYGYVIDFIHLHVAEWYWPDFNIADSAICLGAFMLALILFRKN